CSEQMQNLVSLAKQLAAQGPSPSSSPLQGEGIWMGAGGASISSSPFSSSPYSSGPLGLLEQLHVQAQRLELLDHYVERLGQSGLKRVLALDDRFVHPRSSRHVVGFNREHLLQRVGGAVSLQRPHFHFSQPLTAELSLAAERLLGDQAVGTGRTRVNFVFDQMMQLHHVHDADGDRLLEGQAGASVVQGRLS